MLMHIRRNWKNKHADRKRGQAYEQGHAYNKSTVPKICIEFAGKEQRDQKCGYQYKTKHTPRCARHTTRKTGREESMHIRHRIIGTSKQTEGDWGYYW